jgi:hypothetical protein
MKWRIIMRPKQKLPLILLLFLGGCATLPAGPSVNVLPTPGKSFETFRGEDATCRQWAEKQMGMPGQQTYDNSVATGAVAGTAIGAGLGAALGSASGHAGVGALIGAGFGLFAGTATGANAGQVGSRQAQRRYDNSYLQCMYSFGNQLPGSRLYQGAPVPPPVTAPAPAPPMAQANISPPDLPPPAPETIFLPGQDPILPEVYLEQSRDILPALASQERGFRLS